MHTIREWSAKPQDIVILHHKCLIISFYFLLTFNFWAFYKHSLGKNDKSGGWCHYQAKVDSKLNMHVKLNKFTNNFSKAIVKIWFWSQTNKHKEQNKRAKVTELPSIIFFKSQRCLEFFHLSYWSYRCIVGVLPGALQRWLGWYTTSWGSERPFFHLSKVSSDCLLFISILYTSHYQAVLL